MTPQHHGQPMYAGTRDGQDMRRWLCAEPGCGAPGQADPAQAAIDSIAAAREMHAAGEFADGDFVAVVFDALDVFAAQTALRRDSAGTGGQP